MLTISFAPFVPIETERLILRQINHDDVNELFFLRADEAVMKYIDRPRALSLEDAYKHIELVDTLFKNNEGITWAIALRDTPKMIGYIGIWRINKECHRAEIGYASHPNSWNKGIISEAILPVCDFAFNQMKLHSLEANINPENEGSRKVLEKAGFRKEAYFTENYFFEGKFLDSEIYSKLSTW